MNLDEESFDVPGIPRAETRKLRVRGRRWGTGRTASLLGYAWLVPDGAAGRGTPAFSLLVQAPAPQFPPSRRRCEQGTPAFRAPRGVGGQRVATPGTGQGGVLERTQPAERPC